MEDAPEDTVILLCLKSRGLLTVHWVTSILCEGTTLSCYSLLEKYGQHASSRDLKLPFPMQLLIIVSNSLELRVVCVDPISGNKPGLGG